MRRIALAGFIAGMLILASMSSGESENVSGVGDDATSVAFSVTNETSQTVEVFVNETISGVTLRRMHLGARDHRTLDIDRQDFHVSGIGVTAILHDGSVWRSMELPVQGYSVFKIYLNQKLDISYVEFEQERSA